MLTASPLHLQIHAQLIRAPAESLMPLHGGEHLPSTSLKRIWQEHTSVSNSELSILLASATVNANQVPHDRTFVGTILRCVFSLSNLLLLKCSKASSLSVCLPAYAGYHYPFKLLVSPEAACDQTHTCCSWLRSSGMLLKQEACILHVSVTCVLLQFSKAYV